MKESILIKVMEAFHKLDIELKDSVSPFEFKESITNQFYEMESTEGKKYLIRINGRLWPPFTREDESFNLTELSSNNIKTNVIYNDPANLFQICELWRRGHTCDQRNHLVKIAEQIRLIHDKCDFKGRYPLVSTVMGSYKRFDKKTQEQYQKYYLFILSLIMQ